MTVAMPIDTAARTLITEGGLDATLFVEAGAGTGKTSTLVRRIVNLVTQRGIDLREVAAITFTEAAAAELRDRVRAELDRAATSDDPTVAARARQAGERLDGAAISTLHSFAQRLLSEHPVEVGIPPRVEVLDEVQSTLAFEERWQQAFESWMADPQLDELITRTTLARIEISSTVRASLRDVAAILGHNWDRLEGFAAGGGADIAPLPPISLVPLQRALDRVLALPAECRDDGDTLLNHLAGLERLHRALVAADPHRALRLVATRGKWASKRGAKGNWVDVEAARAALAAADDAAERMFGHVVDAVLDRWLQLLARFTLDAAHERQRAGRLEFHDLLVLARRLLRRVPEARRALRERYTHLLLDEFQDTDPIQIELAVLLAAPDQPPADEAWPEVATDTGRLFFVGDPKQSIYRFRGADIRLFLQARDRFGGDEPVQLLQNFRTVPAVLDWVNHVFGAVMAVERPGAQPRYEPLAAARSGHAEVDHRVVALGGPHDDDPGATELRRREAADVAASILAIRGDPAAWLIERRGEWVEPTFADITVLLPSRTSLPMLEEALRDAGIPWRADTSTLVFDTYEVRELLTVLRAVDDPADDLAIVAACRSPLFACADTDLFDFHEAGGRWDYRDAAPATLDASHPVVVARAALACWHDQRLWAEPSVLLERIVREREVFALALTQRRPRDTWRRVRFLVDQARRFSEAGGGDLRAFLGWADLQRAEGARVPEPLLPETDDDAVRVMTCHGAKGLEFPITIVSGLTTGQGRGRRGVHVLWLDDGRPAIRLTKHVATEHFEARNDFEEEMDSDEKVRLLYVAATRARDHLIISAHHKAGRDGSHGALVWRHSDAVMGHLCRRLEPVVAEQVLPMPAVAPRVPVGAVAAREQWLAARVALLADGGRVRAWSATAIAAVMAQRPSVQAVALDESLADDVDASDGGARRRGRGGTGFGRAVHAVLQFADPSIDDRALRQRAVVEATAEGLPQRAGEVAAAAIAARGAEVVQRVNASTRVWRELFVAAPVGGVTVEGFVDLLGDTAGGLVLVDYKTDAVDAHELDAAVARYRPQAATYALALEQVTGRPVVECTFVFAAPDGALERSVDDLAAAKADVLAFLSTS